MKLSGFTESVYNLCKWIVKFAYVNILWFFFTLCGLIVLGIFPAMTALYTIIRKWIRGFRDVPVFTTFWTSFKKDFISANLLGYIFLFIGFVLCADIRFFQYQEGVFYQIIFYILLAASVLYLLTFMYLFPVYVHYDVKKLHYIKQSFMIMILSPLYTVSMFSGIVVVFGVMYLLPGLVPFFSVSLLAFVEMWFAYTVFKKLDQRVNNTMEKEV